MIDLGMKKPWPGKDPEAEKEWIRRLKEYVPPDGPVKDEIHYQKEVLKRMVKRGCKPCEKRRQQKYIERLQSEQNG